MFPKCRFSNFKKLVSWSGFGDLQLTQISLHFKTPCWNLEVLEQNCVWLFYYFNFERNYGASKSPRFCWYLKSSKALNVSLSARNIAKLLTDMKHKFQKYCSGCKKKLRKRHCWLSISKQIRKKILKVNEQQHPSQYEMSLRDLNQITIGRNISKTSQKHLLRDVFFVTSLWCVKKISKEMSFLWRLQDVSIWEKYVFHVASLKCFKHISRKMSIVWRLWYISKISLESICDCSKIFHENGFVWYA